MAPNNFSTFCMEKGPDLFADVFFPQICRKSGMRYIGWNMLKCLNKPCNKCPYIHGGADSLSGDVLCFFLRFKRRITTCKNPNIKEGFRRICFIIPNHSPQKWNFCQSTGHSRGPWSQSGSMSNPLTNRLFENSFPVQLVPFRWFGRGL